MSSEFASVKQLATRYRVSKSSVWRWSRSGNFPKPRKLSAGCSRWALDEVEVWERDHGSPANAISHRNHK